jgi:hypothetical protein
MAKALLYLNSCCRIVYFLSYKKDVWPLFSAEVKNEWRYTSSLSAYHYGMEMNNVTFALTATFAHFLLTSL